jgi:calcineurin-like phosphoesterase family protein
MNTTITKKWNERVKYEDQVIFLGDFCFKGKSDFWTYYPKLNGQKVFVKGNHDRNNGTNTHITHLVIDIGDTQYLCTHVPPQHPREIPEFIDICLCGHVHEKWLYKKLDDKILLNVGVDVWNFYPITIREIERTISKIKRGTIK